jgi:serralysin
MSTAVITSQLFAAPAVLNSVAAPVTVVDPLAVVTTAPIPALTSVVAPDTIVVAVLTPEPIRAATSLAAPNTIVDPLTAVTPDPIPAPTSVAAPDGLGLANVITGADPSNQILTASAANDTFVFSGNFGQDTIVSLNLQRDIIEIDRTLAPDFGTLLARAQENGPDTVISLDASNTITIQNVTLAEISAHETAFRII